MQSSEFMFFSAEKFYKLSLILVILQKTWADLSSLQKWQQIVTPKAECIMSEPLAGRLLFLYILLFIITVTIAHQYKFSVGKGWDGLPVFSYKHKNSGNWCMAAPDDKINKINIFDKHKYFDCGYTFSSSDT